MPAWLAKTNRWMMQHSYVMDCNTADVRYARFPGLIHPRRDGYWAYAACIDTKFAQTISVIGPLVGLPANQ